MKKMLLTILLYGIIVIGITGCSSKEKNEDESQENDTLQEYKCIENWLGGYIVTENSILTDIPLKDVTTRSEKISYYKGVMANDDNMYIIFEMESPQESEVMDDFESYFSKKFPVYQKAVINNKIFVYIHNRFNDVDFKEIKNTCKNQGNNANGSFLPSKTIDDLSVTDKIIIKSGDTTLGTINKQEVIDDILNIITSSKQYGENFLCDGNAFDFEMYNDKDELVDTIYLWGDGRRLIPKSVHNGCSYYSSTNKDIDLRKIIEQETDYIFYELSDFSDNCDQVQELIYEDDKYSYYLDCIKSDKVMINFDLNNLTMTLKYALNNNYIKPNQLELYDGLLIKKEK